MGMCGKYVFRPTYSPLLKFTGENTIVYISVVDNILTTAEYTVLTGWNGGSHTVTTNNVIVHLHGFDATCNTTNITVKSFRLGIIWQRRYDHCSPREIWLYTPFDLGDLPRRIWLGQVPFGSNHWHVILPHVHSICIICLHTGLAVRARLLAQYVIIKLEWISNLVANILRIICTIYKRIFFYE